MQANQQQMKGGGERLKMTKKIITGVCWNAMLFGAQTELKSAENPYSTLFHQLKGTYLPEAPLRSPVFIDGFREPTRDSEQFCDWELVGGGERVHYV